MKPIYRVAAASFVFVAGLSYLFAETGQATATSELATLLDRRIDVLEQVVQGVERQYELGDGSLETVLDAHTELLGARLDAATTGEQRVEILREGVEIATERETFISGQVEDGTTPASARWRAEANRLAAEIALARELQGQAAP